MKTPLLEEARIALHAALYFDDPDKRFDLIGDALVAISLAIGVVDASREDAHRMEGRVTVDTELHDQLTENPNLLTIPLMERILSK